MTFDRWLLNQHDNATRRAGECLADSVLGGIFADDDLELARHWAALANRIAEWLNDEPAGTPLSRDEDLDTHFNYAIQAWVEGGVVQKCGHTWDCSCNARRYAGLYEVSAVLKYRADNGLDTAEHNFERLGER